MKGTATRSRTLDEDNAIARSCVGNIVALIDGKMVTPQVSCGLLPGTFHARLIDDGKITEAILKVEDLARSTYIFVINSVRKWRKAVLKGNETHVNAHHSCKIDGFMLK
jgi:para-aminobenzoate synthetase / 4-amino-4-deoxychorismate lyase